MAGATQRPPVRPRAEGDNAASELSLHPSPMAVQRDVVTLREVNAGPLFEGLRIDDHAEIVAGGLITHEAEQNPSVLSVAVRLGHEHWLPGKLTRDILPLPLPYLMGVVVLLCQPEHPMVIDDAPAVPMPLHVDLGIDLGLVEAVVRPSTTRALTRGDVQAEASNFAATATPVLDVATFCLTKGKADRRLIVADDVEVDDIAGAILLLKSIDCVEEEQRVCLEDGCVLAGLPVNEANEGWPLWLPCVVVVQVALILAGEQPLALRIQHALPVQGVGDLDHDDVLLRQRDRVHRRRELRLDPGDQPPLQGRTRLPGLIGLHREDDVLGLEAHVLRADLELNC
mmetsp:Transcript_88266/g.274358  ORF Transcript_88266/g.274358 Transcript_88266/m.274358 type:complete len:341 (+) Transcript_88266:343-1365(+)